MADETATVAAAPASLVDHCRHMGVQHDPTQFSSSVPGGVWNSSTSFAVPAGGAWSLPNRKRTPSHSRTSSAGDNDCGVPIFRVDHQMSGDGTIFTPKDEVLIPGRVSVYPTAVPESGEVVPPCSSSLQAFCQALGEKHDPTQFASSIPGGCWGASLDAKPLDGCSKDSAGIPIYRVEHKMDTDGFIFTPTKSKLCGVMVGSLESDSDASSWRGSPVNLFDNSPAPPAKLNLFDSRMRSPSNPPQVSTLSDVLPSLEEEARCEAEASPDNEQEQEQDIGEMHAVFEDSTQREPNEAEFSSNVSGQSVVAQPANTRVIEKRKQRRDMFENETCDVKPKCCIS